MSISIVTWLWKDGSPRSAEFDPRHVNTMQKMVARNLKIPHRFICITDSPEGLSKDVEYLHTPDDAKRVGRLRTPEDWGRFPSCYRRLWTFSPEAKEVLGERVLLLDIDLVILGDISHIFDHKQDFVGWRPYRDWGAPKRFGGGIYLLSAGTRPQVWKKFNAEHSIREARSAGFRGSDQAWISYMLAAKEPYFARDQGIYSIRDFPTLVSDPPPDARLVQLNGPTKPWNKAGQSLKWIRENWW